MGTYLRAMERHLSYGMSDLVDPALLPVEKLAASLVGLLGAARCGLPCGRRVVEREREDRQSS